MHNLCNVAIFVNGHRDGHMACISPAMFAIGPIDSTTYDISALVYYSRLANTKFRGLVGGIKKKSLAEADPAHIVGVVLFRSMIRRM